MTAVLELEAHPSTCACCRPDARRALRRPLTYAERHIDVEYLTAALDSAKARLHALIVAEQRRVARRVNTDDPRPQVRVTTAMLRVLAELEQIGRLAAIREAASMGVTLAMPSKRERAPLLRTFASRSSGGISGADRGAVTLASYLSRFSDRMRFEALRAIQTKVPGVARIGFTGATFDARAIMARAIVQTPGALDAAGRIVSMTLDGGMADIFGRNADAFEGWQYTAVLDGATCPPCEDADGTIYATWDDAMVDMPDGGPNPECDGGSRCRCRLVPIPAGGDKTGQAPPTPTPPVVPPDPISLIPEPPVAARVAEPDGSFSSSAYEDAIRTPHNAEGDPILTRSGWPARQAVDSLGVLGGRLSNATGKPLPGSLKVLEHAKADHELVMKAGREIREEIDRRVRELEPRVSQPDRRVATVKAMKMEAELNLDDALERLAINPESANLEELVRTWREVVAANEAELAKLGDAETHYVRISDIRAVERRVLQERGVKYAKEGELRYHNPTGDPSFDPELQRPGREQVTGRYRTAGSSSEKVMRAAEQRYPTEWIEASNAEADGTLKVMQQMVGEDRSHYAPGRGILALTPNAERSLETAVHELAHRLEASMPELLRAERVFYEWRARGGSWTGKREASQRLYPNARNPAERRERSIFDEWHNRYMGKDYWAATASDAEGALRTAERTGTAPRLSHGAFEIVSQAMGEVFGRDPELLVERDTYRRASGERSVREDRELMEWLFGILVNVRPTL